MNIGAVTLKCFDSAFWLTDDAIITIKQKCLFKGPCIIEVNGQQLSIRHCDACSIALEE
ncbi:ferrous iron transport protein A [Staphylococcus aureus]